ncbi:MAG: type II toxin-antitoxin system VapC family toxin [Acidobacteriaceae bacterium]|jgi:ribonuclease VapC|nr:type II toxin-antitoxin system VapC family toxin [Acidobacteriaceae bacterium]
MIVVDSSAVIAVLFDEPEAPACIAALNAARTRLMSAANYVETGTVLADRLHKGPRTKAQDVLDDFLAVLHIDIAPVEHETARRALAARLTFGQGFGTRGGLNFGDCFAYALATQHAAPLLYVGNDFARTDITSALQGTKKRTIRR